MVGSTVMDSHTGSTVMTLKSGGELVLQKNSMKRENLIKPTGSLELGSSFIHSWPHDWRLSSKMIPGIVNRRSSSSRKQRKDRRLVVFNNLGGQYEDSFEDVKAVRCL